MAGIAGDDRLRARIEQEVNDLMAPFAKWEQVKKITILPAPFTIDGGELTHPEAEAQAHHGQVRRCSGGDVRLMLRA